QTCALPISAPPARTDLIPRTQQKAVRAPKPPRPRPHPRSRPRPRPRPRSRPRALHRCVIGVLSTENPDNATVEPPNAPKRPQTTLERPLERALEWVGWYVSALGPPHAHAPISEPWRVRWYALVARDRARAGCPGPRRPTGTCPLRSPTAGSGSGTPASFHESFSHAPDRGSAIVPDVGLVQTHLDGPRALHGAGATNVSGHLL